MCNPTSQPPRRDIYEIHEELDGDNHQHQEPTGSTFLPENKGDQ